MTVDLAAVDAANAKVQASTVSKVQKTYDQAVTDALHAMNPTPPPATGQLWLAGSFLNTRVPASPTVHAQSAAWIKLVADNAPAGIWPNGQQYAGAGSPTVYDTSKATTTKALILNITDNPATPSPFTFPWNPSWVSGTSGDRQLAIVNPMNGAGIEFQGFEDPDPSVGGPGHAWSAATFNVKTQVGASLPGNRVGNMPLLAGIVRPQDFAASEIAHALRCALAVCSSQAVWPALVSDGKTPGGPPMGAHLWLPRAVSLAQFGIDKWQTMLAVALQEFGTRASDSGGGFSISLQSTADGVTTYPATINALPNALIRQMVVLA